MKSFIRPVSLNTKLLSKICTSCRWLYRIVPICLLCLAFSSLYPAVDFPSKLSYSIDRGFYEQPFDVELTVDTTDVAIIYTLDGSDPSTSATAISMRAPTTVRIDPNNATNRFTAPGVCLRAVGYIGATQVTRVKTHTYLFIDKVVTLSPDGVRPGSQWPAQNKSGSDRQHIDYGMDPQVYNDSRYKNKMTDALMAIPSVSIVTDLKNLFDPTTGIYMNAFGRSLEWERPASVELLNPDGSDGFQIDCGLRIRGGWSRHPDDPKHAFRLFFREMYGVPNLDFPLFGDEGASEFDKVDLRTSQNYSWAYKGEGSDTGRHNTMLRDVFSRDTQRDMGMPYTRSRYYHLYINGVYWGLFQTQERPDAFYGETYFGGASEDYDVIKKDPETNVLEANDGNIDTWNHLWDIARRGFTTDADYYLIQGKNPDGTRNPAYPVLVDMDNLITYMICTFYVGDYDGPVSAFGSNNYTQNWFGVYNHTNPDGFKFFRHDAEHSMFLDEGAIPGAAIDRTGPYPAGSSRESFNPQWLHQQLVNHPAYILRFADWVHRLFFDDGALTPDKVIERVQERKSQIELAIIAESARWGDSKVSAPRTYHKDWLPAVEFLIDDYAPIRTDMVLNQFKGKGWYPEVEPPKFSLSSGVVPKGSQLFITSSEGIIFYTLDGSDVLSPPAVGNSKTHVLFGRDAQKYALVPQSDIGTSWRTQLNYNTAGWSNASGNPGGIGYETGSGFETLISLDVRAKMYDPDGTNPTANTSCYVRIPFVVSSDLLNRITSLSFISQYDDGVAVYLNGTQILADNVPANPTWNSVSSTAIGNELDEKTFNISNHIGKLVAGDNLLTIHALNTSRQSSDFLVRPYLLAGEQASGNETTSSALTYNGSITIEKSCVVKARAMSGRGWSTLDQVRLWVLEDVHELRISEIHYHPLDEGVEDNDSDYEFIELKNMGADDYDVSQCRFTSGIDYTFPMDKKMHGGEILVLASNAQTYESRYGFSPFGEYQGQLDNSGEDLVLEKANGDTLIHIRYNDKYPWPVSADGEGYSMVVRSPLPGVDIANGAHWVRSANINGSPGQDDLATTVQPPQNSSAISTFQLFQNYPNPFNAVTTIRFQVAKAGQVKLTIHNTLGQQVARVVDGDYLPGDYHVQWRALNFASGVYFYHIEAGGYVATRKLLLLK